MIYTNVSTNLPYRKVMLVMFKFFTSSQPTHRFDIAQHAQRLQVMRSRVLLRGIELLIISWSSKKANIG